VAWAGFVVLSAYFTGHLAIVPGFLFGFGASVVYFALMFSRVKKCADMPTERAIAYMRFGWVIRLVFVLAVLSIALKIPGIEFLAAVAGLLSLKIVIVAEAFIIVTQGLSSRVKNNVRKE
jgi:hypothetical protein